MEVYSGLTLSKDGVVSGCWSESSSSLLLRSIRKSVPGDWLGDVFFLAQLAHEILTEYPSYSSLPIFTENKRSTSLSLEILKLINGDEWDVVYRVSDDEFIAATNIARWILRLPQQTDAPLVFVSGPSSLPAPRKRLSPRTRVSTV